MKTKDITPTDTGSCDPCERFLPRRLSCCDCANFTKLGCVPYCGLNGQIIPFPHLYICSSCQIVPQNDQLCRRCCADGNCGTGGSKTSDCCCKGQAVNSCKGPGEPPEANDIWSHMRCSYNVTLSGSDQTCRRCCGDECGDTTTNDSSCKCCMTIVQRMNF